MYKKEKERKRKREKKVATKQLEYTFVPAKTITSVQEINEFYWHILLNGKSN